MKRTKFFLAASLVSVFFTIPSHALVQSYNVLGGPLQIIGDYLDISNTIFAEEADGNGNYVHATLTGQAMSIYWEQTNHNPLYSTVYDINLVFNQAIGDFPGKGGGAADKSTWHYYWINTDESYITGISGPREGLTTTYYDYMPDAAPVQVGNGAGFGSYHDYSYSMAVWWFPIERYEDGTYGNQGYNVDYKVRFPDPVPEPASGALLGLGLIGAALWRRRRS